MEGVAVITREDISHEVGTDIALNYIDYIDYEDDK
jgi:hypothetical protein